MSNDIELLVRTMTWEADGVLSLDLCDPAGSPLPPWRPGAHVEVTLGKRFRRQFSLCGDANDRNTYRLGILREPESRGGTRFVHDRLRPGDLLGVSAPRNNFEFLPASRYLFLAGGIGITPLLPMIREAAAAGADWRLLYGGRRRASMAFVDELANYGERVTIMPEDEYGLLDLDAWLAEPRADTTIYGCGPEALLSAVEAACAAADWPTDALHVERFHARPQEEREGAESAIEVECKRSGVTVTIGSDETILHALEAAGVPVDSSCQEGICGTCETRVVEGVPDHRDSLLSPSEREASETMMICCSRARSPVLVLDV